jgi:hypothetical protein
MQFLDTTTLLTIVSRLDTVSRRLVSDQEVWRYVTLGGSGLALTPNMNVSSGPDAHLASKASALALDRVLSLTSRWTLVYTLDLSGAGAFLRDDFFIKIEQHPLPYWSFSLRELSLARCTLLTDASLQILASVCSSVTKLDLSWCSQITDEGFETIVESCGPSLRVCVLNRCHGLTDAALGTLANHASALVDLDLTFCTNLTDHALELLAATDSRCFYPIIDTEAGADLTAVNLPTTLPVYTGLQKLSLRWCRKITDIGIQFLMCGGVAPEPTDGRVMHTDVDDNLPPLLTSIPLVPSAAYRANALRSLNVDHCSLLTDRSMMHISKSALHMRELSAIYCKMVSTKDDIALARVRLHRFDLILYCCVVRFPSAVSCVLPVPRLRFDSSSASSGVGSLRSLSLVSLCEEWCDSAHPPRE